MKAVEIKVTLTVGSHYQSHVLFKRNLDDIENVVKKTKKSILDDLEQVFVEDGLDLQADGKLKTEQDRWEYENKQRAKWEKAMPKVDTKEVDLKTDGNKVLLKSEGSGVGVWLTQEQFDQ